MIELDHLVKNFGGLMAVNDVSLTIPRGEFFALLGCQDFGNAFLGVGENQAEAWKAFMSGHRDILLHRDEDFVQFALLVRVEIEFAGQAAFDAQADQLGTPNCLLDGTADHIASGDHADADARCEDQQNQDDWLKIFHGGGSVQHPVGADLVYIVIDAGLVTE